MTGPRAAGFYRTLTSIAAPLAPLWLRLRVRMGKEDPDRWREKLGESSAIRPHGRVAWLHGVSVGESLSLLPLAERIAREQKDVTVLVTSGTRASGDLLAERLPPGAIHQYAPLDTPAAVDRFLRTWRPSVGVIVESELWPNLILAARARGVRLVLASGRVSASSARSWARAPRTARAVFTSFELVLARDEDAAARLTRLGARVDGVADLKFGAPPLDARLRELAWLRARLEHRPVILAASTHPGEEAIVLESFAATRSERPDALLIIAPRHAERGGAVLRLATDLDLTAAARSSVKDPSTLDVYVADTLGEMGLWFRLARLAFLGGSLVRGPGGHNPLEPARVGCPVVSGDKVDNWPVYRDLRREGAVDIVGDGEALERAFARALADPGKLTPMADKARAFVAERDALAREAMGQILALFAP